MDYVPSKAPELKLLEVDDNGDGRDDDVAPSSTKLQTSSARVLDENTISASALHVTGRHYSDLKKCQN